MISKTRSDFMPIIDVEGVKERDILTNYWEEFETKRPVQYHNVSYGDSQRPDLISLKYYGTDQYWWVVCKYNQIDDVWNDLIEGDTIKIPHIQDIREFYSVVNVNG